MERPLEQRGSVAETEPRRGMTSVAIVGASPRSFWSQCAVRNLKATGGGRVTVWPVTPAHEDVLGMRAYPDVGSLPGSPDVAIIAVRRDRCPAIVADLAAAGTREVVIVSDGFVE